MSILPKLMDDLKLAMRNKDEVARDTLRMLKSALSKKELDLGRKLDGGEELAVLMSAAKSRKESMQQYVEAGRQDLADSEAEEIKVIGRYLPQQISETEAKEAIMKIAADNGFSEKKDMGKLMKLVLEEYRGQIDGKMASKLAASVLS